MIPSMVAALILSLAGCHGAGGRGLDSGTAGSSGSTDSGTNGPATDGASAGGTTTDGASAGGTTAASDGGATSSGSTAGPKFDVGINSDVGVGDPCGDGGEIEFSYIWIASATTGTIYKIDTFTGDVEGRYYTHPSMGSGQPSRTSVNLLGDVAVSNRQPGSVTKISARLERCVDVDNNGTIRTSSGIDDILPWGSDECVLWHRDFPDAIADKGARPTQWEAGANTGDPCQVDPNPRLWVGYLATGDSGAFVRLDGATGQVQDRVDLPGVFTNHPHHRPYGGVVNGQGDLWAVGHGAGSTGPLVHIDAETLTLTNHGNPSGSYYGLTIDADGNPWASNRNPVTLQGALYYFDTTMQTFGEVLTDAGSLRGSAADKHGRIWAAANGPCGLVKVDVATKSQLGSLLALPGCITPVGVSIDVEDHVWVVDSGNGNEMGRAYKIHPDTHAVVLTVENLENPYTYSDMTGAGLRLVSDPTG